MWLVNGVVYAVSVWGLLFLAISPQVFCAVVVGGAICVQIGPRKCNSCQNFFFPSHFLSVYVFFSWHASSATLDLSRKISFFSSSCNGVHVFRGNVTRRHWEVNCAPPFLSLSLFRFLSKIFCSHRAGEGGGGESSSFKNKSKFSHLIVNEGPITGTRNVVFPQVRGFS